MAKNTLTAQQNYDVALNTNGIDKAQLEALVKPMIGKFPDGIVNGLIADLVKAAVAESSKIDHVPAFMAGIAVDAIVVNKGKPNETIKQPAISNADLALTLQACVDRLAKQIKAYNAANNTNLTVSIDPDSFAVKVSIPAKRVVNRIDRSWNDLDSALRASKITHIHMLRKNPESTKQDRIACEFKLDADQDMTVFYDAAWHKIGALGKTLTTWESFNAWRVAEIHVKQSDGTVKVYNLTDWLENYTASIDLSSKGAAADAASKG